MFKYEIGQVLYNRGDMANVEHWAVITNRKASQYGIQYELTPQRSQRMPYWIAQYCINGVDKGHHGTRIVTKEAHEAYREAQRAALARYISVKEA